MIPNHAIPGLVAAAPPSLAAWSGRIGVDAARARAAQVVGVPTDIAAITRPFARGYRGADRRALLSYWSLFDFAALIAPTRVALVRLRRVLPVALAETGLDLDENGGIARFWIADAGRPVPPERALAAGLDALVDGHIGPFVEACAVQSDLSARVLWCNAGVMLDFAARELDAPAPAIAVRGARSGADALLGKPFACPAPVPRRRVCCLRLRLPDVPSCGALCPRPTPRGPAPTT